MGKKCLAWKVPNRLLSLYWKTGFQIEQVKVISGTFSGNANTLARPHYHSPPLPQGVSLASSPSNDSPPHPTPPKKKKRCIIQYSRVWVKKKKKKFKEAYRKKKKLKTNSGKLLQQFHQRQQPMATPCRSYIFLGESNAKFPKDFTSWMWQRRITRRFSKL